MKLDLTGIHIEITDAIKVFTEKKVEKLEKFFDPNTIVHVTYSAKKEKQNVDIRIEYKSKTYIAEDDTDDIYSGIEKCVEKIESQVRKAKDKKEKNRHQGIAQKVVEEIDIKE